MLRKHIITTFLFLLCALAGAQAQQLIVSSFKCLPTDLDARVNHSVTDHNGKKCAIIKVENSNTGFAFDTGTLAVQKVEQKTGEIWVYVQPGVRKMTISHQTLGILREYAFPEQIKEATVYVMKLESGNVHTIVEQAPTGAYLTMRLTPTNATVWIDDELQSVVDGEVLTFLTNGSHTYRVQAAGFAQEIGKVEINAQRKDMQVALQSTKATLTLFCADTQATLFIDGKQVGTGQWSGELIPGTHILEAKRDNHRAQTKQIELKERETLEHRFEAPVAINGTLQIASRPIDSEVWIDGKKIGTTPYGPEKMIVGTHSLELRKEGYRSLKKEIVISEGETCLVNNNLEKEVAAVAAAVDGDNNIQTFTVNGVSFSMVEVAGGTFTMGATSEQGSDAYHNEKPTHKVTLDTYHIGQTEVTQALWQAVMGKNPSLFKGDNLPVEQVSWNDCQKFIKKLNALTGKKFRLPTEAEWEYAARGGNRSRGYKYSGNNKMGKVAWCENNSGKKPHAVATKKANELGIYDMSGNVCEWCSDWYGNYSSSSQVNPVGSSSGSDRVSRGGCFLDDSRDCRVSNRNCYSPGSSYSFLGLRLVLDEKGVNVATNVLNDNATPANSGKNMDFTVKGVKFSMVKVGGGTFTMGATGEQGSDAYDNEKPAHKVTLDTYLIGQTEVTQALWKAVMGNNPSYHKGDNLPVEKVTWNDCQEFIKKLNALTGKKFRLPTEAEWEYAARGGNRSRGYKYSGSNNRDEVAWYYSNSGNEPHAVATKKANELGIYDMSGNVCEWCSDWYGEDYYSSSPQVNPTGPSSGSLRVGRGVGRLVSRRDGYSPREIYSAFGLRLVLEP